MAKKPRNTIENSRDDTLHFHAVRHPYSLGRESDYLITFVTVTEPSLMRRTTMFTPSKGLSATRPAAL